MSIALVAGEAGAVVRPNVVCTVGKHVAWSENGKRHHILSSFYEDANVSPVFALIVIGHTAAFASPPVIAVTLKDHDVKNS